jgi:hypothetical protein
MIVGPGATSTPPSTTCGDEADSDDAGCAPANPAPDKDNDKKNKADDEGDGEL